MYQCRFLLVALMGLAVACQPGSSTEAPFERRHPFILFQDETRNHIGEQIQTDSGASVLEFVRAEADEAFEDFDTTEWNAEIYGDYGFIAETSAFLNWFEQDCSRAAKVIEAVSRLQTNWDDHSGWGINIRMPSSLMHYTSAWDLMVASDCDYEGADEILAEKLTSITAAFFDRYILDPFYREASIGLTQNNHPIRTAAAIGMVGLAFEDVHPDATAWLNWAVSELDYLWGPDGRYVQPGGAVNEGPHYYGYAFAPTVGFLIALHHGSDPGRLYERDCINRSDLDPWTGHNCVDGEAFVFLNPLVQEHFWKTVDWSLSLRLPDGRRAPVADAPLKSQVAAAILPAFGAPDYFTWDWISNVEEPFKIKGYHRLPIQHLAYAQFESDSGPPDWTHHILPDSGVATLRSGWTPDDIVVSIWAEAGAARKAVHNHVDSTSFVMSGMGELFITDTGYYKPNAQDNAVTASPQSHNVILIDGKGAPSKGLLTSWGDADASIENPIDDQTFGYVEAVQTYEDHTVRRGIALARGRYSFVTDFVESLVSGPHTYQRRLHAYAGEDLGGSVAVSGLTYTINRPSARLDIVTQSTLPGFRLEAPERIDGQAPHVHALVKGDGHHEVIDGIVEGTSPGFLSVMVPSPVDATSTVSVTELLQAEGSVAYRIAQVGEFDDVIWLRQSDAPQELAIAGVGVLSTDADWVWIGLGDSKRAQRSGSYLRLEGDDLSCVGDSQDVAFCSGETIAR